MRPRPVVGVPNGRQRDEAGANHDGVLPRHRLVAVNHPAVPARGVHVLVRVRFGVGFGVGFGGGGGEGGCVGDEEEREGGGRAAEQAGGVGKGRKVVAAAAGTGIHRLYRGGGRGKAERAGEWGLGWREQA